MKKLLLVLTLTSILTACSIQRFDLDQNAKTTIPSYEGMDHFIFWGIGQTHNMNPNEICGARGVNAVDTYDSFLSGFLSAITWGIYSPRKYRIYCNI